MKISKVFLTFAHWNLNKKGMEEFVGYAFKCGFLKEQLDLSKIFTDAGK